MVTKNTLTLRNANARAILVLGVCALFLGACHGGAGRLATSRATTSRARTPVPPAVQEARRRIRAHDRRGALRLLQSDRGFDASEPERSWLLAALWLDLGGRDGALARAQRMPASLFATALRSLLTTQPADALRVLMPGGGRLAPHPYADLAAAVAYAGTRDVAAARRHAMRAWTSDSAFAHVEATLVLAQLAMEEGDIHAAGRLLEETFLHEGAYDARLPRLHAQLERRGGRLGSAAKLLLAALRVAPRNEHVARDLADLWREGLEPATQALIASSLGGMGSAIDENPEAGIVRGMTRTHSQPVEAVRAYEQALAAGAVAVPAERELRILRFRLGQHTQALDLLRKALPPGTLDRRENRLHANWQAVWRAGAACPVPAAGPTACLALARALVGVGALEDATAVLEGGAGPAGEPLHGRLVAHHAFEAGLRELIESGYQAAAAKDDPPDFDTVLAALPGLAQRTLSPDEALALRDPTIGRRSMPLVGSWLDHRVRTSSPLVRHFRNYGRYVIFGQRSGAPVEVIVFSIASLEEAAAIKTAGRTYRHDLAIGYDRGLRSHVDAQGGSLGGACLADSLWIDADSARYGEHALRRSLVRDPAVMAFLRRSQPPRGAALNLDDPGMVAIRLFARYVARRPTDEWGSFYTLQAHEFGHVVDLRDYLPLGENLGKALGLLAGAGFSASRVEMELERRAQLAACVDARDPDLALAEMCLALPVTSPDPEVHDGGYRDGLRDMVQHWMRNPARYPSFDATRSLVGQMDRLDNETIRRLAYNALLRR